MNAGNETALKTVPDLAKNVRLELNIQPLQGSFHLICILCYNTKLFW